MNSDTGKTPGDGQLLALYERMLLIRRIEERFSVDAAAGKLPGAVHLYIGQEAVAAAVCMQLDERDWITSTHRGHGHFLAKGGDPKAMVAEIWGKRTGICRGMGGSMHVADLSKGILGANGIVAAGLPIAAGAAFAAKLSGDGRIAVSFFGDGASNAGVFMECLNVSTLWQLPMIFLCEYNGFSEFTRAEQVTSGEIVNRARAFGMPSVVVDGNDALAVWAAAADAIERARSGGGPSFIEARTYRIKGHLEAEALFLAGGRYRTDEEIEEWRRRDPIQHLGERLLSAGTCAQKELDTIEARVMGIVEDAVAFAEAGEPADPELAFELMFAGQKP
jgi:TPP-dependent pyruvate/acetoin dehydrogenase alpha subunit